MALPDGIHDLALPSIRRMTGGRLVIWGAGELGGWLARALAPHVVAFVDMNPTKHGTVIEGVPVHPPTMLGALAPDAVWISVLSDAEAVRELVEEAGYGGECVVPFEGGKRLQVNALLPRLFTFLEPARLEGRSVLELGFGGNLYFALSLLWAGAARVTVSDVQVQGRSLARRAEWRAFVADLTRDFPDAPGRGTVDDLLGRIHIHPKPVFADCGLPEGPFDAVASTGVLEHIDDPEAAIRCMAESLSQGGVVVSAAVGIHDHRANRPEAPEDPWSFLEVSPSRWLEMRGGAYHQNRWRSVDFDRAFVRHGFEVVHREAVVDPRLTEERWSSLPAPWSTQYTRPEVAELDYWSVARRR